MMATQNSTLEKFIEISDYLTDLTTVQFALSAIDRNFEKENSFSLQETSAVFDLTFTRFIQTLEKLEKVVDQYIQEEKDNDTRRISNPRMG